MADTEGAKSSEVIRASRAARVVHRLIVVLMLLLGLAMGWLGIRLMLVGGSVYYAIAGIGLIISGVLLFRFDRRGTWVYAAVYAGTFVWSLWEAGLDGWALLPRLGLLTVLGLWLLTPWAQGRGAGRRALTAMACMLVLAMATLAFAWHRAEGVDTPTMPAQSVAAATAPSAEDGEWRNYGNDLAGTRFSALDQIRPDNVTQLRVAWTYHLPVPGKVANKSLQVTPLMVGGRLYLCNQANDIVAVNPETGKQLWLFHAQSNVKGLGYGACRGVAYYRDADARSDSPGSCAARIITATVDARLVAVDAERGTPCADFGVNGAVSLLDGMGVVDPGYYYVTSAPQIIRGKIVVGGWVSDNQMVGEPSGVIRAFDARTGKFAWAFDMGRPDDHGLPPQGQSYTRGTPNSWAPMSADEKLGLVYIPTGNATPDWYGGHRRPFDDRYSSSILALDAGTGAVKWAFQTTHHDLWDYDVGSQPTLVDLPIGQGTVPALIQLTKRGEVFLLDRRTGAPLSRVEERPVPASEVPGEHAAKTQPFSVNFPAFAGPPLSEVMMWGLTPIDQALCRIAFRSARYDGPLTPVGIARQSISYPGHLGGMDWGSASIDRDRGLMLLNSNRVAVVAQLIPRARADAMGIKPIGQGGHGNVGLTSAQAGTPFAISVAAFLSQLGVPCQQPPYGMISAIDLKARKTLWTQPFGTGRDSGPFGIASHMPFRMGVPSIGGPVTTRSGLTFVAASQDNYLRAYETRTGRELWRGRLPAGGQATPSIYRSPTSGRQFVVIAAGGHPFFQTKLGNAIVAYALPAAR